MEELKPCPFCGDNGIYDTNGKSYWVICAGCGARVAGTYFSGEKGKKIITERWNKRTSAQGHENDHIAEVSKKDTISRQAAIDAIDRMDIPEDMCVFEILSHIELEIGTLPSIQPKRGRWIDVNDNYNRISGRCSVCGWESHMYEDDVVGMNYCPNCGSYNGGGA